MLKQEKIQGQYDSGTGIYIIKSHMANICWELKLKNWDADEKGDGGRERNEIHYIYPCKGLK